VIRIAKWLGGTIAALALIGLALYLARPLYLDHVYYRGPASDHYDGQRFFNPDGDDNTGVPRKFAWSKIWAMATAQPAPGWPRHIAVTPTRPPARVAGRAMRVTWIGHSTVLVQTEGLNILTDPVWSDVAGPWNLIGPRRSRAPGVRFEDLPRIDLVLLSHNHYDHMDLPTLEELWHRDRPLIVTSLGNDTILKRRGIAAVALDWGRAVRVRPGIWVIVERVHHWDSRWGQDRNRALWSGFTVTLCGGNIFFAGDTGYGDGQWARQANRHGPFRLAILPIGAYFPRAIFGGNHIDPEQAVSVFEALGARTALGVHWGTFHLTDESAFQPPIELAGALRAAHISPERFRATQPGAEWMVP
jgi:L-ascorbate metabolism protein UlaG (beta-lactamase superfamily)